MLIQDFMGRGAPVRGLCEAFEAGAPPHANLLIGSVGVGKRTIAHTLAQSLFCSRREGQRAPCGVCPGCRRYLAGSHPDAYCLREQGRIGVDDIRAVIASLQSAAYEGGWRTVVIEAADSMTAQAQNSLLKTLEEPPPRTVFLLTATSAAQLLPTIRSRARAAYVPPMPQEAVERILTSRDIPPARAALLASLAEGSIGRALTLHGDESFWALRARLHEAMASIRGPGGVLAVVSAFKADRGEAPRVCDLLEEGLRASLTSRLTGKPREDTPWSRAIAAMPPDALAGQLERVAGARRMLASNVSWQAVLERFLLDYSEELLSWQQ